MEHAAQFKTFLEEKNQFSKATIKNYTADVAKFIRWFEHKWNTPFAPHHITPHIIALYAPDASKRSLKRYLSSLRLFSRFLKTKGYIATDFQLSTVNCQTLGLSSGRRLSTPPDPWHLKNFRAHLSSQGSSRHTIKNYISDIQQFLSWVKKTPEAQDYTHRLVEARYSFRSINRKLSSIRNYIRWYQKTASSADLVDPTSSLNDWILNLNKHITSFAPLSTHLGGGLGLPRGEVSGDASTVRGVPAERGHLGGVSRLSAKLVPSRQYSRFPPLRLAQKTTRAADLLFERTVILPLATLMPQPLFRPVAHSVAKSPSVSFLSKGRYWYRKYHSYTFVHALHHAILILFVSVVGYILYEQLSPLYAPQPEVLSSSTSSTYTFLFRGKLTDSLGNPITNETAIALSLYPKPDTPKTESLYTVTETIKPLQDGSFSIPFTFPYTIVSTTPTLYLGAFVFDQELTPRQPIPTVGLANDTKTLEGLPPITKQNAGTTNVVLALDSAGNLTIPGFASPTFQATGGSFTLSGQSLLLATNPGSNGSVVLSPEGSGFIDLQKSIQNTQGLVEIDDTVSILATESDSAALTLNQDGGGHLLRAVANGVSKFGVDFFGNTSIGGSLEVQGNATLRGNGFFATDGLVFLNGSTVIGSSSAQIVKVSARIAKDSHLIPETTEGTNNLGETTLPWDTLFVNEVQVGECIKTASGSALLGTCPSDIRLKENITPLGRVLERMAQLVPVRYTWKDSDAVQIGLIAQQVEQVLPEAVTTLSSGYKAIRFEILPFYMLQAIRELDETVKNFAVFVKTQMLEATYISAQAIEATEKVATTLVQTRNLLATEEVVSPLAQIDTIHTDIISPLASNSVTIHLGGQLTPPRSPSEHLGGESGFPPRGWPTRPERSRRDGLPRGEGDGGRLIVENASGSAVATIDSSGNASFSGTLRSEQLAVNSDATVSGTLRASKIFADAIEGATLSAQHITNLSFPNFSDGLVAGPSSFTDIAVASQLSIGSQTGGLRLADNTINVLGSTLELQPLRQGAISFMAGAVSIDTDGNLIVSQNASFAKDVAVKGTLLANIIRPIPDQDLVIHLGGVPANTSEVLPRDVPDGTSRRDSWDGGRLVVQNASGSAVLTINQKGDLNASGSGTFADLFAKSFTIVRGAQADTSLTETVASSSAGVATVTVGETQRLIRSPFVLPTSLIYITATSDTNGQTLYVARQGQDSFTVAIPERVSSDIHFNWWILN